MAGEHTVDYHCPDCGYAEQSEGWSNNGWQCRACGRYQTPDKLLTSEDYADRADYDERDLRDSADGPVGGEGGADES